MLLAQNAQGEFLHSARDRLVAGRILAEFFAEKPAASGKAGANPGDFLTKLATTVSPAIIL